MFWDFEKKLKYSTPTKQKQNNAHTKNGDIVLVNITVILLTVILVTSLLSYYMRVIKKNDKITFTATLTSFLSL